MFGARLAGQQQSTLERLPCPVEAYRQVVYGKSQGTSHRLATLASQVDTPEQFSIFGSKSREKVIEALADNGVQFSVQRLRMSLSLMRIGAFVSSTALLATMVVGEGRAQDAVEPGDYALTFAQMMSPAKSPKIEILQHVFGLVLAAQAACEKSQESPTVLDQCRLHRRIEGPKQLVILNFICHNVTAIQVMCTSRSLIL